MSGAGQRGDLAPRFAWTFAAAFLCLILPARSANAASWAGPAGVAAAAALFALPLLYTIPRTRAVWARHRGWLLAAQAILTYLPFAIFGQDWVVGLSGLLGGLLLLTVRAPASWSLFGAVVAVEGVLRVGVLGGPPAPGASLPLTVWAFIVLMNTALALFGLVRLADLVTDLHATRTELAALAVTQQRLRSASRLREAIDDRLETITARAKAALPVLARSPELARGQLTEAAGVARQALDQVREVVAGDEDDHSPPETGRAGDTVAPRLARLVLVVVLCAFLAQLLVNLVGSGASAPAKAGAVAATITVLALQLYHSLARSEGARPRGWAGTLAAQMLVSLASFRAFDELSLIGLAGFAAGSALLLLPRRWAWAALVAIPASAGTLMAAYSPFGIYDVVYIAASTAATGLMVYGLSRLTDLAHQVEAARRELARMAMVQERLRVARDTHDLLGLGLSAVALKCDLVVRLIGRDDARARSELERLLEVTAKAGSDIRTVTDQDHRLSLDAELTSARDVLASAGIDVHARVATGPFPAEVATVLATVLREAVTNILRHAAARRCTIELSTSRDAVHLRVTNDGVTGGPASQGHLRRHLGGRGLANLSARAVALGGRLDTHAAGSRFELTVRVPLPAGASARRGGEDTLATGDPADGVDDVVGGAVLDQES